MKIKFKKIELAFLFSTILFLLGFFIPWTTVLGGAGLLDPEIAQQISIYSNLMYFLVGVMINYGFLYLLKRNDKYGDNMGFFNKGETMFKNFTYPQITLYSIILFGGAFILANLTRTLGKGFFGLKVLPMQFSAWASLLVSSLQIPIAENLMAIYAIGVIIIILSFFAIRFNMSVENYKIIRGVSVVSILAILGVVWHKTVYFASEIAQWVVGIFWGIGGFLSVLTGSFIPFWVMHTTNNFFIDFSRLFSSDMVLYSTVSVWFLLFVMALIIYRGRYFGKRGV